MPPSPYRIGPDPLAARQRRAFQAAVFWHLFMHSPHLARLPCTHTHTRSLPCTHTHTRTYGHTAIPPLSLTHTHTHTFTPHAHQFFFQDENDPKRLLSPDNIDRRALERYAIEATAYATDGALGSIEFEKNHRGENDVALFDFTSLFASENAARIMERKGKKMLLCVAGDSLLEVHVIAYSLSS